MERKEIVIKLPEIKCPKFMKSDEFLGNCSVIFAFWLVILIVMILFGLIDTNHRVDYKDCEKTAKIDYIFPGHQLGCWLGKEEETIKDEDREKVLKFVDELIKR